MRTPAPRMTAILVAILFAGVACSSGGSKTPGATSSTTSRSSTSTSTTVPTTATTSPFSGTASAVWPTAASTTRFHDPIAAARSFATAYLHMVGPAVGPFTQGDARSGEVAVRQSVSRPNPVTTVLVRRLGPDDSWWVLGSSTPNIRLSQPAALSTIASPVRLRGRSTAFEATVNVSVRADDRARPLADTFVMGGANGQFGPFDASVAFTTAAARYGAIVLYTISSETGHVSEATVIRVRF